MKCVEAAIAIVTRGGKVLICQRRAQDKFGGYWEFPGGKLEPGETIEDCLHRELQEEVALVARPIHSFPPIEHDYPHARVRLHPVHCEHVSGEAQKLECQDTRWIDPEELEAYRFPPANEELVRELRRYLRREIDRERTRE
jgi:mutator protein MutT